MTKPAVCGRASQIDIDFIPYRGNFAHGIFCTTVVKASAPIEDIIEAYKDFYADAAFTHYDTKRLKTSHFILKLFVS